jgi:hypothetical protein
MNHHICNETRPRCNETRCLLCGAQLAIAPTGRPPKFCSAAHRVAFHRRRRRATEDPKPAPEPPTRRNRAEALREIEEELGQLGTLRGATELRHLAERAQEVVDFLDNTTGIEWALDDLHEVADGLNDLRYHRDTLDTLVQLDDLAYDLEDVARSLRAIRRQREAVRWAAEDAEQEEEE